MCIELLATCYMQSQTHNSVHVCPTLGTAAQNSVRCISKAWTETPSKPVMRHIRSQRDTGRRSGKSRCGGEQQDTGDCQNGANESRQQGQGAVNLPHPHSACSDTAERGHTGYLYALPLSAPRARPCRRQLGRCAVNSNTMLAMTPEIGGCPIRPTDGPAL